MDPISIANRSATVALGEIRNLSKPKVTTLRKRSSRKMGKNKINSARIEQPIGKKNICLVSYPLQSSATTLQSCMKCFLFAYHSIIR
jgi:hypothetical protein